jgi:hypothetical protein
MISAGGSALVRDMGAPLEGENPRNPLPWRLPTKLKRGGGDAGADVVNNSPPHSHIRFIVETNSSVAATERELRTTSTAQCVIQTRAHEWKFDTAKAEATLSLPD